MQQPLQQVVAAAKAGTALTLPSHPSLHTNSNSPSPTPGPTSGACAVLNPEVAAARLAAAGPFGVLTRDALLDVCCLLNPADVASLGQTCSWLHEAVEDGAVWQLMMRKAFPGHRLQASSVHEWKAAFQLESSSILDELRCWLTRAGPEEDVLGVPLTYTLNPATQRVDYIQAHPDVLSVTAFKIGVRVTPQGEAFDALLPLYLTADHFNRALPHMAHLLPKLAPEAVGRGGSPPAPEAWLDVLAKIMNTQVVLLCNHGLSASQRSLSVYCQVHRLLLAVCEHWGLWHRVAQRLDTFLASPAVRVKSSTPTLGVLMALLAVGSPQRHSWVRMSDAVLKEGLSRQVLWMCKKDPSLVQRFLQRDGPADPELLSGAWQGAVVSTRLYSFHVAFLQLVACPRGATLESVMDSADALYGWPAAALGVSFQRAVRRILQVSSWQQWFTLLGRQAPSDADMTKLLRWAWKEGASKGYHSARTDFSRVQASGVSKILLKGQTHGLARGTKKVHLNVYYKWRPEVFVRYLDGAVMLMGQGRQLVEMVAWNHQSSTRTARPGAVVHSGDIMEFENQKGHNNATVNFANLGPAVHEMFVTLSAWADAQLSDIVQPYVQLKDPDSGVELCQVHFDTMSTEAKRSHKCAIMARFYKAANGDWAVTAVNTLCQGNTSDVELMVQGCQAVRL